LDSLQYPVGIYLEQPQLLDWDMQQPSWVCQLWELPEKGHNIEIIHDLGNCTPVPVAQHRTMETTYYLVLPGKRPMMRTVRHPVFFLCGYWRLYLESIYLASTTLSKCQHASAAVLGSLPIKVAHVTHAFYNEFQDQLAYANRLLTS
jgi:hypothetical protein